MLRSHHCMMLHYKFSKKNDASLYLKSLISGTPLDKVKRVHGHTQHLKTSGRSYAKSWWCKKSLTTDDERVMCVCFVPAVWSEKAHTACCCWQVSSSLQACCRYNDASIQFISSHCRMLDLHTKSNIISSYGCHANKGIMHFWSLPQLTDPTCVLWLVPNWKEKNLQRIRT
jgi:hypothetical protein